MSRWSSGQDVALSRLNQGFDSPTRYHPTLLNVEPFNRSAGFLFSGSVKNVGVADTPRISEPISFFEKTLFFIGSFGSIPQIVSCRTSLFFSIGFSGHQGTKR